MLDWLLSPIDAARGHDIGFHLSWHARLMVFAWAILVPIGILAARFFKIVPGQDWPRMLDHKAWWRAHRFCQYTALALMAVALVLILRAPDLNVSSGPHAILGWTVLTCAAIQLAGGMLRGTKGGPGEGVAGATLPGDHYDMTPRRLAFEFIHKSVGYVGLIGSVAAILAGLWQSNALVWMWLTLVPWWCLCTVLFVQLQRRGYVADTYEAIWGPDPEHPGNNRRLIGWGIRRRGPGKPND